MPPTLLFSSFHNYLDQASGAAISAREVLRELARRGWRVRVLCGSFFDDATADENSFYATLKRRDITPVVERKRAVLAGKNVEFRLVLDDGIEATVFFADDAASRVLPRGALSRPSGELLLKLLLDECQTSKPNVYLTYGGYWAALPAAKIAKNFGAANVFYLCNFAYNRRDLFAEFDRIVVPSEFAKSFYRQKLDVVTDVIPPLIDDSKFRVAENSRRFLTFVNPSPEKGRYFFVGIARELERRFPEIPILVVESRSKITTFATSPEARTLANLYALQQVDDPREFYRQTRILLGRPFAPNRSGASRSRRDSTESRSFARIAARFRKSSKVGDLRSTFREVTRRRRERFRRRTKSRLGSTLSQRFGTTTLTRKRSPGSQGNASNVIRFKTSPRKPPRSLTTSRRNNVGVGDVASYCDAASLPAKT